MALALHSEVRIIATRDVGFVVAVDSEADRYQFAKTFKGSGISWHSADELEELPKGPLRPVIV